MSSLPPEDLLRVAAPPTPTRAALYLALAHRWEAEIAAGIYRDRADIARTFGLTRARVTQIMDLTLPGAGYSGEGHHHNGCR
jgi:hypothetical protein